MPTKTKELTVKQAKEIVQSDEWSGDMRSNWTRTIAAGRVLSHRVDKLEEALQQVIERHDQSSLVVVRPLRELLD